MTSAGIPSLNRARGCLLGLAVGDAVGAAVEFAKRESFEPVVDMVGGGPFGLEPGQWTDDTSMALCLADSLIEKKEFDPEDQMLRYLRWRREGYRSSTGQCFDIGTTVEFALLDFERTENPWSGPTDVRTAGNGSIMRLAPVILYFMPNLGRVIHFAQESSKTTHGAPEAVNGCRVMAQILFELLQGADKHQALRCVESGDAVGSGLRSIANCAYLKKKRSEIRGSGYVVESLEAALWCFARAESFEEAVLEATNLGDDADTTAAVCGQLAGAYWGESGIPRRWLSRLCLVDDIRALADQLSSAS